jgi:hypothetical protein
LFTSFLRAFTSCADRPLRLLVTALVALPLLLGASPLLTAGAAQAVDVPPNAGNGAGCTRTLTSADFVQTQKGGYFQYDGAWGQTVNLRIEIRRQVVLEDECAFSFSLASYETDGPTWPTSGDQRFLGHDTITLSAANRIATLSVPGPKCFGQVDLYHGTKVYDGGTGEGHGPVPRHPDVKIPELISASGGGAGCAPEPPALPSAELTVGACVDAASVATVTLGLSEGSGSAAFTVWAKTGDGGFTQVGGTTTLPDGPARTAQTDVPLVEDSPVTIQVRAGDTVLETFDPVTADCVAPPVTPSAEMAVDSCVDGAGTATVTLAVSAGSGTKTFTVWAKVDDGAYAQVGPARTLPAGASRTATVGVPRVEDQPVTVQVRSGTQVVRTFEPVTVDCVLPPVVPSAELAVDLCDTGTSATVTLAVSEGSGSSRFTVWSRTGAADFTQVGTGTVLPAGDERTATVAVPLVEDEGVTIQVRVDGEVLRTFDPVTADCRATPEPPARPSTNLEVTPCTHGMAFAGVNLRVSEGTGSSTFTVWARVGRLPFVPVSRPATLPSGNSRARTVTVPLLEGLPTTIQVRVGDKVLRTFDAITADCVKKEVSKPTATATVGACTNGSQSVTVKLSTSTGSGSQTFTVWAKTGSGSYSRVGGAVTLTGGKSATTKVGLVEDKAVTIQVRVGDSVLKTFGPYTADCKKSGGGGGCYDHGWFRS